MKVKSGTHRLGRLFEPLGYGYRGRHAYSRRGARAYVRELARADGRPWWTYEHGPTSGQLITPLVGIVLASALFIASSFAPEPFPRSACFERPDLIRYGVC